MSDMRTLLYMFRGKLETEQINRWKAPSRAAQLQGCTGSVVYLLDVHGNLLEHGFEYWVVAKDVPEEIKLAAMLVN